MSFKYAVGVLFSIIILAQANAAPVRMNYNDSEFMRRGICFLIDSFWGLDRDKVTVEAERDLTSQSPVEARLAQCACYMDYGHYRFFFLRTPNEKAKSGFGDVIIFNNKIKEIGVLFMSKT